MPLWLPQIQDDPRQKIPRSAPRSFGFRPEPAVVCRSAFWKRHRKPCDDSTGGMDTSKNEGT